MFYISQVLLILIKCSKHNIQQHWRVTTHYCVVLIKVIINQNEYLVEHLVRTNALDSDHELPMQ